MSLKERFNVTEAEKQRQGELSSVEKKKALVDEIVSLRKKSGLSQRQVAKKCNRKTSFIAKTESFKNPPDIYTLTEMAVAIGCEIMVVTPEERMSLLKYREEKKQEEKQTKASKNRSSRERGILNNNSSIGQELAFKRT